MKRHRSNIHNVAIATIFLFIVLTIQVSSMVIRREVRNPFFSFYTDKCKSSPDPSQTDDATYFLIECQPNVDQLEIIFNTDQQSKPVYDTGMYQISSLTASLTKNTLSTYYVYTCENPENLASCLQYQLDVRKINGDVPRLVKGGLVFSKYLEAPRAFDPNVFSYNVTLFSGEPVTVTAIAEAGFYVDIGTTYTQKRFIDGTESIVYTPKAKPGQTEAFYVWITDSTLSHVTNYTVTVLATGSGNPRLSTIDISPGRLDPKFDPNKFVYYHRVPEGTTSVSVTVKAINEEDTDCKVLNTGLVLKQKEVEKSWIQELIDEAKYWTSQQSTTSPEQSKKNAQKTLDLRGSGSFSLQLPPNIQSPNIVIECSSRFDTSKSVRYVVAVIPQKGGSTQLLSLDVSNSQLDRQFDPNDTGPYEVKLDSKDPTSKWVRFRAVTSNSQAHCRVEGHLVDPVTHMSKQYHLPLGKKHTFQIEVTTDSNPAPENYFIIVSRPAPWYKKEQTLNKFGNAVAWISTLASATRGVTFINNVKMLQIASVMGRINGLPESYDTFTNSFHKFNLQDTRFSHVDTSENASNKTLLLDKHTKTAKAAVALPKLKYSSLAHPSLVSLSGQEGFSSLSNPANLDAFQYFELDEQKKVWLPHYKNREVFTTSVAKVLDTTGTSQMKSKNTLELQEATVVRQLLELNSAEQKSIMLELDAEYKKQEKLLSFCSSLLTTTTFLFGIACAYGTVWLLFLHDKSSITTLRNDFPTILAPGKFWVFIFDYVFISYLQSAIGILSMPTKDALMELTVYGLPVTARRLAAVAAIGLVLVPLSFFSLGVLIIVVQSKENALVFSSIRHHYHDRITEYLKFHQTYLEWLPIIGNFFTVEISSPIHISKFSKSEDDGDIIFHEATSASTSLMVGDVKSLSASLARNHLNDPERGFSSIGEHQSLLSPFYDTDTPLKYNKNDETLKTQLHPESFEKAAETLDPCLYSRFPQAVVGYTNYKVKNAYDKTINVEATVQLQHLPALMNIKPYSLWVPWCNLRKDIMHTYEGFFGSASKNTIYFWALDRGLSALIISLLCLINDSTGVIHLSMFAVVCLAAGAIYIPGTILSATSRWLQRMVEQAAEIHREEATEKRKKKRGTSWPFCRTSAMDNFKLLYKHKKDLEMWGLYSIYRQYVKDPLSVAINWFFWNTRLWFIIKEVIIGSAGIEIYKALLLFTLLMGSNNIQSYSNSFASMTATLLLVLALVCLNARTCILDWKKQLNKTTEEIIAFLHQTMIFIINWCQSPRTILPKITHCVSSVQRIVKGERGVCFGYPRFSGSKTRKFKVNHVNIISNELGVQLPGVIKPNQRVMEEMKAVENGQELYGIYKTLYVYGPLNAYRSDLYRTMPVQVPLKQFFQAGKGDKCGNMLRRLACTIQIVNFNESRGCSGYKHTSDDDSFLSLYTSPALMPEHDVQLKHHRHGYVVRWIPGKEIIFIRGPGIEAGQVYSITSRQPSTSRSESEQEDTCSQHQYATQRSASSMIALESQSRLASACSMCYTSGKLTIRLDPSDSPPDLCKPIFVCLDEEHASRIQIDPTVTKVDYYEYNVGKTKRCEMILSLRDIVASRTPYIVDWHTKQRGRKINAAAQSTADGVLNISWPGHEGPDLESCITIRNETPLSPMQGAVIDIDPKETDKYQFVLPPVQYNSLSQSMAKATNKVFDVFLDCWGQDNSSYDHFLDPIPCTVVQCVNPIQNKFRVEPNFDEAIKAIRARVEQMAGIKRDLDDPQKLGYVWVDFMSYTEFISFWENAGIPIVIRGAWINPLTNTQHLYIKENIKKVAQCTERFREILRQRVEDCITYLNTKILEYSVWEKGYNDNNLYATALKRDRTEWTSVEKQTNMNHETLRDDNALTEMTFYEKQETNKNTNKAVSFENRRMTETNEYNLMRKNSQDKELEETTQPTQFQHDAQQQLSVPNNVEQIESNTEGLQSTNSVADNSLEKRSQGNEQKPFEGDSQSRSENQYMQPKMTAFYDDPNRMQLDATAVPPERVSEPRATSMHNSRANSNVVINSTSDFNTCKAYYENQLPQFQYPMTIEQTGLCKREKLEAQLRVWREEVAAWLFQCEGASLESEQGGKSCAQAVVDDTLRVIEKTMRSFEHSPTGAYRPVLHYTLSSATVRGHERNWKPDPLAAHYSMVRLFRTTKSEGHTIIDWASPAWVPCFLKLMGDRIVIAFPNETDALADLPEYDEIDITKRFSWNQVQGYYIPLECLDRMFLSFDPKIEEDTTAPNEVKHMHAKLMLRKATEYFVDDAYIKNVFDNEFMDEIIYHDKDDYGNQKQLKLRLCHTIHNKDQTLFNSSDAFYHGDKCSVLPLTFRFHHAFFNKWQSAIRLAEMNNPRKEPIQFNGHTGSTYTASEADVSSEDYYAAGTAHTPISSASSSEVTSSEYSDTASIETPPEAPCDLTPINQDGVYKGTFRDFRFTGKNGRLYDHNGTLVYSGDWAEGQRWGHGLCVFRDAHNLQWEFEGKFIADEMFEGRLNLTDTRELGRLRESQDKSNNYALLHFNGTFRLPSQNSNPQRKYARQFTNCAVRSPNKIHPTLLKALFLSVDKDTSSETEAAELVIDIRRAISVCADESTWKAITNVQTPNVIDELKSHEEQEISPMIPSKSDVEQALEEYLPHTSRWIRQLDPSAGFHSLAERLAHGTAIFADGSKYRGDMKQGRPHGRGVLHCPKCNLTYNGNWKNGYPDGYGVMTVGEWDTNERMEYYGNFRHGLREGNGTQLLRGGKIVIRGEFKDDLLHGEQCCVDLADDVLSQFPNCYKRYLGGVQSGVMEGKGKLFWPDGVTYTGEFHEGQRQGCGTLKSANRKTVISGQWVKDLPEGRVTAKLLPDGKVYSGDMKNGKRQGVGELFNKGALCYEGLWYDDVPHGRGILFADDGVYEGEFRKGLRHGKGSFQFNQHRLKTGKLRCYEGDWAHNLPDGTGRYVNELGIENTYKFKNGQLVASSVKAYQEHGCGKTPPLGRKFAVTSSPIISRDSADTSNTKTLKPEFFRSLHSLGADIWPQHINKNFVFVELSSPENEMEDKVLNAELPEPPYKKISIQSFSSIITRHDLLRVVINSASELIAPSQRALHPYCRVRIGRFMKRTKPIDNAGTSVSWACSLNFPAKASNWVEFELWNKDPIGPDLFVGAAEYNLHDFYSKNVLTLPIELKLTTAKFNGKEEVNVGTLRAQFHLYNAMAIDSNDGAASDTHTEPTTRVCNINVKAYAELYSTDERMNPYFLFDLGGTREKTSCISKGGKSGKANLTCAIPYRNEPTLRCEVWDKDTIGNHDTFVGYATIILGTFTAGHVPLIRDDRTTGTLVPAGDIELEISCL